MPPNTMYVGRPTKFGNPFETADEFRAFMSGDLGPQCDSDRAYILGSLEELAGMNLACWCGDWDGEFPMPRKCHAEYLLILANPGLF